MSRWTFMCPFLFFLAAFCVDTLDVFLQCRRFVLVVLWLLLMGVGRMLLRHNMRLRAFNPGSVLRVFEYLAWKPMMRRIHQVSMECPIRRERILA